MSAPLEGIRVLELGYYIQAPFAAELLGEYGAEIIKIEEPGIGDPNRGVTAWAGIPTIIKGDKTWPNEHFNANKKSITVNLRSKGGKEIIKALIQKSDVFVHNLRRGAAEKLNVNYEYLSQYNSKLVYASGSGFGPKGPDAERIGFDYLAQARSGMMLTTGEQGMPPVINGASPVDVVAGSLLTTGILLALMAREHIGHGQEVDVSLLGSAIHMQRAAIFAMLSTGKEFVRHDRTQAWNVLWNHYQCADGKWIALAMAQSDKYWKDFCKAIDSPLLADDPKYNSEEKRQENTKELVNILDKVFKTKPRDEWIEILKTKGDFGYDLIKSLIEVTEDTQVLENQYISDFDHPELGPSKVIGPIIQLSQTPAVPRKPAPELGQDTEMVLTDLCGFTWDDIIRFQDEQAI